MVKAETVTLEAWVGGGELLAAITEACGKPVSIVKSSAGFPTVAEQQANEGREPYNLAMRRRRRRI